MGIESNLFGVDLFGDPIVPENRGPLALRFDFPPFTVLNAREGEWQERKRAWVAIGIKSEVGRNIEPTSVAKNVPDYMANRGNNEGGSIFDPVLCEMIYKWWAPAGGLVLDPFAGGSVRGIVAGLLGLRYHGIELRPEQVAANREQAKAILPSYDEVGWICGDSALLAAEAPVADFVLSCPPYGDLEVYSDDRADLSNMEYDEFLAAYQAIIMDTVSRLKVGRFAAWVVGDFRDQRTGMYRGFVADTIMIFRKAGMELYNDAILVTSVGSLPIRVSAQFDSGRKLGKTHQNVLVFAKGAPAKDIIYCGDKMAGTKEKDIPCHDGPLMVDTSA